MVRTRQSALRELGPTTKPRKRVNPASTDDKPPSKRSKSTKTQAKKRVAAKARSSATKRNAGGVGSQQMAESIGKSSATKNSAPEKEAGGSESSPSLDEGPSAITVAAITTKKHLCGGAKPTVTREPGDACTVREATAEAQSTESKSVPEAIPETTTTGGKPNKPSNTIASNAASPLASGKPKGEAEVNWDWLTYCTPSWAREKDSSENSRDDGTGASCGGLDCKCGKSLSQNPSSPWFMSKNGAKLAMMWQRERLKRCQDEFEVYFYNGFSGDGTMECVDNILLAVDKELSKKRVNVRSLWALVEGLGFFFACSDNMDHWFVCDDRDGVRERIEMLGVGLLTTMFKIVEKDTEKTAQKLKNKSTVLALWLAFADDWDSMGGYDGSTGWRRRIVELAGLMGIDGEMCNVEKLRQTWRKAKDGLRKREKVDDGRDCESKGKGESKGKDKTKDANKEIEIDGGTFDRDGSGERQWNEWCWPLEFDVFKEMHGIQDPFGRWKLGGGHYDLTKWAKRDLEEARLASREWISRVNRP